MEMTRLNVGIMRTKLNKVLAEFAKENGLVAASVGRITFDSIEGTASFKVEVVGTQAGPVSTLANLIQGDTAPTDQGDGESAREIKFRRAYERNCGAYGLQPEWLDQTFISQGKTFKIIGLNTNARGYPVIAKAVFSGKNYKFPAARVRAACST